jgi:hypothetical protein
MTILTVDKKEFERKVGKLTKELEEKITEMGTPIEEVTDEEISVEVFPNRPDLLRLNCLFVLLGRSLRILSFCHWKLVRK